MNDPRLENLTKITLRSYRQTEYLLNLVKTHWPAMSYDQEDFHLKLLAALEYYIFNIPKYNRFVPETASDLFDIMSTDPKKVRKPIEEFYNAIS